jgi:hypothetical protein
MSDDANQALVERRKKIREEQAKIRRAAGELKKLRAEGERELSRDQLELFK